MLTVDNYRPERSRGQLPSLREAGLLGPEMDLSEVKGWRTMRPVAAKWSCGLSTAMMASRPQALMRAANGRGSDGLGIDGGSRGRGDRPARVS